MSDDPRTNERLSAAITVVARACRVCRAVARDLETVRALTKDDRSPVTVADFACQAIVLYGLRDALGEVPMVAEESAEMLRSPQGELMLQAVIEATRVAWPNADASTLLDAIDSGRSNDRAGGFWTLDPIDGTKGFLLGGHYAVSLAWIEAGQPRIGVLGCPNLPLDVRAGFSTRPEQGTLMFAVEGGGAQQLPDTEPNAPPTRIRSTSLSALPLRLAESRDSGHTNQDATTRLLDHVASANEIVRLDSQTKYAVVARAQADVYLRLPQPGSTYREAIWDHAAGCLIARETGCLVTDVRGEPLDFGRGERMIDNVGVLCARSPWHAALVAGIRELGLV